MGKQCKAKAKSTGERCKKPAVPGREVCRIHGGATPRGIASPHFKTGRYSKDLPTRLVARYQEAIQDTELLSLRDEIALLDSYLQDSLKTVATDSSVIWDDLRLAQREFLKARDAGDPQKMATALENLNRQISKGIDEQRKWEHVLNLIERRRKLVESERNRLVQMQQIITAEQAMVLMAAIVDIIRRNVRDRETLTVISNEISKLAYLSG